MISLIQTAEGALNETHAILQRMRELAVQASNDTNTSSDRDEIQKEINQLTSEINRIGNTTEFNTQKLLNGGDQSVDLSVSKSGKGEIVFNEAKDEVQGIYSFEIQDAFTADDTNITIGSVTYTIGDSTKNLDVTEYDTIAKQGAKLAELINNGADKDKFIASWDDSTNTLTIQEKKGQAAGSAPTFTATTDDTRVSNLNTEVASVRESDATLKIDTAFEAGDTLTIGDKTITFGNTDDYDVNVDDNNTAALQASAIAKILANQPGITSAFSGGTDTVSIKQGGGAGFTATFQVGANEGQSMTIEIGDMRASALGLTGQAGTSGFTIENSVTDGTDNTVKEAALDVSTHENAAKAITVINEAIEKVSAQRSNLGAFQNRLEHTINNLSTSSENLTAAESRIRDVDYALAA